MGRLEGDARLQGERRSPYDTRPERDRTLRGSNGGKSDTTRHSRSGTPLSNDPDSRRGSVEFDTNVNGRISRRTKTPTTSRSKESDELIRTPSSVTSSRDSEHTTSQKMSRGYTGRSSAVRRGASNANTPTQSQDRQLTKQQTLLLEVRVGMLRDIIPKVAKQLFSSFQLGFVLVRGSFQEPWRAV